MKDEENFAPLKLTDTLEFEPGSDGNILILHITAWR